MGVTKLAPQVYVETSDFPLPGDKSSKQTDRLVEASGAINKVLNAVASKLSFVFSEQPNVENLEVAVGLKFSAEGSVFVAKTTGEATLNVKMSLKRAP